MNAVERAAWIHDEAVGMKGSSVDINNFLYVSTTGDKALLGICVSKSGR